MPGEGMGTPVTLYVSEAAPGVSSEPGPEKVGFLLQSHWSFLVPRL